MATIYPDWKEKIIYSNDGPKPQVLEETDKLKVILSGLAEGQKVPVHPAELGMYYFLEGTGWMTVDEERFAVQPGAIVIVPSGAKRGIEAETQLAFLAARVVA